MPKADALLAIVSASDSNTSFFICIVFLWFFRPSIAKTGNEGCNEFVTTFNFFSWPTGRPLPSGGISRCLQPALRCGGWRQGAVTMGSIPASSIYSHEWHPLMLCQWRLLEVSHHSARRWRFKRQSRKSLCRCGRPPATVHGYDYSGRSNPTHKIVFRWRSLQLPDIGVCAHNETIPFTQQHTEP